MANFARLSFLPLGFELIARQISISPKHPARFSSWSSTCLSAPFSLGPSQDDPSLRALYEPYPSALPNKNVFEAENSEYTLHSSREPRAADLHRSLPEQDIVAVAEPPHTVHSNAQMLKCIYQKDYAGAIALRRDLEALHTPIIPRDAYAKVAQHLLKSPDTSDPYAFLQWCELLPSMRQPWSKPGTIPPGVDQILSRLLRRPEAIDLLFRFSVLAVRKGMARWVAIPAISHITRYSTPEISSKLLAELVNAASSGAAQSGASTIPPKVIRRWNNTFVRTLCLSGRLDAAYQSIVALHSNRRTLSPNAYRIVAEELEQLGRLNESNHVRTLFEDAGFLRPYFPTRVSNHIRTVPIPRESYSKQRRWIKTRVIAGRNISVTDLASFMKSTNCRGTLLTLKHRLLKLSPKIHRKSVLCAWATAEMQLCRFENRHADVLSVFQSNFLPVGLTTQLLHELGIQNAPSGDEYSQGIWPPSEAIALASSSAAVLAASHANHETLEKCYSYFLQSCNPTSNMLFQLPPAMLPDAAAFQPWIGAFAQRGGPDSVVRIMKNMRELGIPPTVKTWNALAKAYVLNREWEIAKSIVMRMEKSLDEGSSSGASSRLRNRVGPIADWGFPPTNTSTYYLLLRELLITNQTSAAKELANMLEQNSYRSNDSKLNSLLRLVEREPGTVFRAD